MIKKKRNFGDLFYNNRFLLVFSVCVAVIIWVIVAVEFSPETRVTIKNVPIKVIATGLDEESELRPYGADNLTADITIVGKRYIVEDEKIINDLDVVANTGYVNSVGVHRLTVDVGSVSTRPQYEIVSCSVNEIEVMYDYYKEKQVPVASEITIEKGELAADGYFASEFMPSTRIVTVYGPQSEVDLINAVSAVGVVEGGYTTSGNTNAALSMVMTNKAEPVYSKIKANGQLTMSYYIYKEAENPEFTVDFYQNDSYYPNEQGIFSYEVIVPEGTVFGFQDGVEQTEIVVAKVNINDLVFDENGECEKTVIYKGAGNVAVKNGDKRGSVDVVVKVRQNEIAERAVSLKGNGEYVYIESLNSEDDFEYTVEGVSGNIDVVMVKGPREEVSVLGVECLRLDFSNVASGTTGKVVVPLKLDSQYSTCWIANVDENEIMVSVEITGAEE